MILNFGSLTVIKAAYFFFVQQYFKIQSTSFITAIITTAKLLVMSFWWVWSGYIVHNLYSLFSNSKFSVMSKCLGTDNMVVKRVSWVLFKIVHAECQTVHTLIRLSPERGSLIWVYTVVLSNFVHILRIITEFSVFFYQWDINQPQSLNTYKGHSHIVYCVVWSPRIPGCFASASGKKCFMIISIFYGCRVQDLFLASQGFPADAKQQSSGTDFSVTTMLNNKVLKKNGCTL